MKEATNPPKIVHSVLAHSYLMYFLAALVGLALTMLWPVTVLPAPVATVIGVGFLIIAPLIILWAQRASAPRYHQKLTTTEDFKKGPYAFLRAPTHFGLDLLVVGFGFLINSLFVIVLSILSYVITRLFFVRKQERLLAEKYGQQYHDYKKTVRIR